MNTQREPHSPQPNAPQPNVQVAARIEELLREQLEEMGVNIKKLTAEEISAHMKCHIGPDNSLSYFWKNHAILDVIPEQTADGTNWRMFTKEDKL